MFGNKYAGDNIAQEFQRILQERASLRKQASTEESHEDSPGLKAEAQVKPEDFLVAPEEGEGEVGAALDSKIAEVDSYAKDECPKCKKVAGECVCPKTASKRTLKTEDVFDSRAAKVLTGLGKMAADLRGRGEGFAADMVEATAMGIKDDLVKEAARKAYVLDTLTKMATNLSKSEDPLAADLVKVTISKIKNS